MGLYFNLSNGVQYIKTLFTCSGARAKPYLDQNIAVLFAQGIRALEQSIVLFPAIPDANIGSFSFDEETESWINEIESNKGDLDSNIYTDKLNELNLFVELQTENTLLKKKLFVLENTILTWDDKFEDLSIDELKYLDNLAREIKYSYAPQGSVGDDEEPLTDEQRRIEAKEDIRELIFKTRKDGKELKGIKRESDLKFRL